MFNLILFGPPGSGKGTQSDKLIKKYGWIHLSTGDILRRERENNTLLGQEAQSYMDRGQLVPDEVVIGMIRSSIDNNPSAGGFLFDGFRCWDLRRASSGLRSPRSRRPIPASWRVLSVHAPDELRHPTTPLR